MAYPVLLWDDKADEMACTGCMACVNYCPTQCISATVAPNPRFRRGESTRKTAALSFHINLPRCIECGICVDVCKYDAIALGYGGPAQVAGSGDGVAGMAFLLELGRRYSAEKGAAGSSRTQPVEDLLAASHHRLPPASASDGARRARSRLRNTRPVRMDIKRPARRPEPW